MSSRTRSSGPARRRPKCRSSAGRSRCPRSSTASRGTARRAGPSIPRSTSAARRHRDAGLDERAVHEDGPPRRVRLQLHKVRLQLREPDQPRRRRLARGVRREAALPLPRRRRREDKAGHVLFVNQQVSPPDDLSIERRPRPVHDAQPRRQDRRQFPRRLAAEVIVTSCAHSPQHHAPRLYFRITSRSRSCGSAWTVLPSMPVIVSAATSALTIASSVACDRRLEERVDALVRQHLQRDDRRSTCAAPGLAVEKARKMSPETLPADRRRCAPRPSAARIATRLSWCGSSGASVATTTMIEPVSPPARSGCGGACDLRHQVGDLAPDRHAGDRAARRACRSSPARARRPCSARRRSRASTRDAVPMPPLNWCTIMPVPPPTLPSATAPPWRRRAPRRRARPSRESR